ncbi:cytosol aminopeptidase isoform X2 [Halyomorpha halys]|uniref:cytosol aminopeptidase isoform X2 n=1 Tax=Halyomorpha halys TaxID=286706 RepID=UPI0006D4FCE5|nr:cytosol aminopeptidase isoform X2 [Halyomorpha halys]
MILSSRLLKKTLVSTTSRRWYVDPCCNLNKKGLVLGAYDGCDAGDLKLTKTGAAYDDKLGGKIQHLIRGSGLKKGEARVFTNISPEFYAIAVAGLGKEGIGYNEMEELDYNKENIRVGAGLGARYIQEEGAGTIFMEDFSSAEASSEAGVLATWKYEDLKTKECQGASIKIEQFCGEDKDGWQRGFVKAEAQNIARKLEETPSNIMNPTAFTQVAIDVLCPCGIQIEVRDRDWIENKKMFAFLSISKGSCEHPLFLEIAYCGTQVDDKPVVFIGKGITFDSGGLCLKPCENMSEYRADLAGAAVVVGLIRAIAQLSLPVNVMGLIPLCENMPGGMAIKPGDVVQAMNGRSIRVQDTDNEGRVIMADTLCYAAAFQPCLIMDIGTFTPGIRKAVGAGCSAVFSTSDVVWRELRRAGSDTGDRVWRFPFWKYFTRQVTDS